MATFIGLIMNSKCQQTLNNINKELCKSLVEGMINNIISHKLNDESINNCYPGIVGHPRVSTRISWCYGDVGIALCFVLAGKTFKRNG